MFEKIDILTLITSLITISGSVIAAVIVIRKFISNREQEKDLSLFFGDRKNAREYRRHFIRTQGVDRPPDDEEDFKKTQSFANQVDLIDFFIKKIFKKNQKIIFLILADAGMGKTTFLVNLFYKYTKKIIRKRFSIRYIALGDPFADEYIEKYKNDTSLQHDGAKTILLLDAFDEDPKALANYSQRFNDLVLKCRSFAYVIITSRTQFFPEETKEKFTEFVSLNNKANTYLAVAKKYIAPFSDHDIQSYLEKKYSTKFKLFRKTYYINQKLKMAEDVCRKATNLVARPMLLENIELILSHEGTLNYESEIYAALIQSWIIRESKKQRNKQPDDELFINEMGKFIKLAALNCYKNFKSGNGLYVELDFLEKIAAAKSIVLDKMDLSARSLLNRNSKGRFKFSHKTVFEYLLADYDLHDPNQELRPIDFSSFDFGLYIRNQVATLNILKNNKQFYFALGNNLLFKKLSKESVDSLMNMTAVIAVNCFFDIQQQLRHLERLTTIYLLNTQETSNPSLALNFSESANIAYIDMSSSEKLILHHNDGSVVDLSICVGLNCNQNNFLGENKPKVLTIN